MKEVKTIEEGVEKLLTIRRRPVPSFSLEPKAQGDYLDTLVWDGQRIPLFDRHYDPRIRAVARYGSDPALNCALNVYSFTGSEISLSQLIYQEADIAEFILHSRIKKVTAFVGGDSVNMIAVMENGTCANMDLGCTMAPGSSLQCQHRLVTQKGMANDLGVTDMTVQHQVNVYGADSQAAVIYDDDEYYLYGLDEVQVRKALTVHAVLAGQEPWQQWADNDARYRRVVDAVYASSQQGKTIVLAEEGVE